MDLVERLEPADLTAGEHLADLVTDAVAEALERPQLLVQGGGESRGGQIGKRKGAGDDSRVTTRVTHTFTQKGELKLAKYLGE